MNDLTQHDFTIYVSAANDSGAWFRVDSAPTYSSAVVAANDYRARHPKAGHMMIVSRQHSKTWIAFTGTTFRPGANPKTFLLVE